MGRAKKGEESSRRLAQKENIKRQSLDYFSYYPNQDENGPPKKKRCCVNK